MEVHFLRNIFLVQKEHVCTDELISTPNITTFILNPPFDNQKVPHISNEISYPKYGYLSGSGFSVKLTALNKELLI